MTARSSALGISGDQQIWRLRLIISVSFCFWILGYCISGYRMAVKVNLTKDKLSRSESATSFPNRGVSGRVAGLRQATRFALGREAHVEHQRAQAARHAAYRRELFIRHTLTVDDFTSKSRDGLTA